MKRRDRWLDDMTSKYRLVRTESFAFPRFTKNETGCSHVDHLDEYTFVPDDSKLKANSRRSPADGDAREFAT
jgi:hypothetical protein